MKNIFLVIVLSLIGISVFAQSDIAGEWNTGDQNTVVKIEQDNGIYIGKIISSDNPEVKTGKLLVKELRQTKGTWKGKLYAPKRNEWYDADFVRKGNKLMVEISVGFFSKTIEWTKKTSNKNGSKN
jgi:uncharacterized protein (DUF2147 family)